MYYIYIYTCYMYKASGRLNDQGLFLGPELLILPRLA